MRRSQTNTTSSVSSRARRTLRQSAAIVCASAGAASWNANDGVLLLPASDRVGIEARELRSVKPTSSRIVNRYDRVSASNAPVPPVELAEHSSKPSDLSAIGPSASVRDGGSSEARRAADDSVPAAGHATGPFRPVARSIPRRRSCRPFRGTPSGGADVKPRDKAPDFEFGARGDVPSLAPPRLSRDAPSQQRVAAQAVAASWSRRARHADQPPGAYLLTPDRLSLLP